MSEEAVAGDDLLAEKRMGHHEIAYADEMLPRQKPMKTEKADSADLIVIGFGAAGGAAAVTAADLGADVIILEKQPAIWHTPSARASGGMVTAVSDPAAALTYFDRCAGGMIPRDVTKAWVEAAAALVPWLEDVLDIKMVRLGRAQHPDWEGAEAVAAYGPQDAYPWGERTAEVIRNMNTQERAERAPKQGGGALLFGALERAVQQRPNVRVYYEQAAARLVQGSDGRVIGVTAQTGDETRSYQARSAVLLACGGYGHDEAMKVGYLRGAPTYFYGSPMNTGDGVRMAQAVGADLWHMNSMVGRAIAHFELDNKQYNFAISLLPGGYVLTDKYGRRFANEYLQATMRHDFYYELINYDAALSEYPRIPCYWFFDQRRVSGGPIVGGTGAAGPHRYIWSPDNVPEIARGWIVVGDSFEDVARRAGIASPIVAAQSLRDYNDSCFAKTDPFGRPADSLIPLDSPPYYCMKLWPGGPNTSGGPRRNDRAQVIDAFGDPIPGLYGAGELGQAIGALYPAFGGDLSDALCFGRIAAKAGVEAARQLI